MISIVSLAQEHLVACHSLEQLLFADESPWSLDTFRAILTDKFSYYYAAIEGEQVVGFAGAYVPSTIGAQAEIHNIAVHPDYQGRGVGKRLLERLLEYIDRYDAHTFLEVRVDNERAIGLYRQYGFELIGTRKRYYQPSGMDAYVMCRESPTDAAVYGNGVS